MPDKERYYTWTNNIETFLENIKFKQARINLFKVDALNFCLDEIMDMLKSIENNPPTAPVKKKERKSVVTNKVFIVHGHNEAVKEKVASSLKEDWKTKQSFSKNCKRADIRLTRMIWFPDSAYTLLYITGRPSVAVFFVFQYQRWEPAPTSRRPPALCNTCFLYSYLLHPLRSA